MLRSFSFSLGWRLALLIGAVGAAFFSFFQSKNTALTLLFVVAAAVVSSSIWHLVHDTNRRLARFFESVRYSDFAIRFSKNEGRGESFEAVSREFNEVLEAFRQTRAEKEANLVFLNALVQQLSTGLLVFDASHAVLLSNSAAFQFLGIYRLQNLHELPAEHAPLRDFVQKLSKKDKLLYAPQPTRQLAVLGSVLHLQGRAVRLVTLTNIHPELQEKELDAWRNLTRVLRHEIMNSITPIVSLVETMQEIVQKDLKTTDFESKTVISDLDEALDVVASRSRGLVRFVDAYRSFTSLPLPKLVEFSAKTFLEKMAQLTAAELKTASIFLKIEVEPTDLSLAADDSQLEMALLNLIKNARESLVAKPISETRLLILQAGVDAAGHRFVTVEDNGVGIESSLAEEIFIPFFTTKTGGTGVGLSLSRQIMQAHGGSLRLETAAMSGGSGARFVLNF